MIVDLNHLSRRLFLSVSGFLQLAAATCLAIGLLASTASAKSLVQREGAPLKHLNLGKGGLALDGYDPVAYFPEGGGKATKGKKELTVTLRGVTYRFANKKNRSAFLVEPERFEADYGGWCAWAMTKDKKVEVDPTSFLIEEDRLLLFFDGLFNNTRKSWKKKGGLKLRPQADMNWDKIIGKKPGKKAGTKPAELTLGLEGNDPVSYGNEGGPRPGLTTIVTKLGGVEYRFLDQKNQLNFLRDPEGFLKVQDSSEQKESVK